MVKTELKAAAITGICGIIAALITGVVSFFTGSNSAETEIKESIASQINSNGSVGINIENQGVSDVLKVLIDNYQNLSNNYLSTQNELATLQNEHKLLEDNYQELKFKYTELEDLDAKLKLQVAQLKNTENINLSETKNSSEALNAANEEGKYTWLNDMEFFNCQGTLELDNHNKDNNQNNYTHSIAMARHNVAWDPATMFVEYKLNGKYKTFEAVLAVPFDLRANGTETTVIISLDDEEKYRSPIMTNGSEPQNIVLDVSGVNKIKLFYDWPSGMATLFDCKLYQ